MLLNPLIIIAALLLMLVVGGLLTWVGLRPRRVGDTPFCKKCGYNMTGCDDGQMCPECGSLRGVVRGERKTRKVIVVLGVLLMILGLSSSLGIGYAIATNFDYYPYLPQSYLAMRYKNANPTEELKITRECWRRVTTGEFDRSLVSPFVGLAVEKDSPAQQSWKKEAFMWWLIINVYLEAGLNDKDAARLADHLESRHRNFIQDMFKLDDVYRIQLVVSGNRNTNDDSTELRRFTREFNECVERRSNTMIVFRLKR